MEDIALFSWVFALFIICFIVLKKKYEDKT
jgi:hypothetical protein